MKSKQKWKSVKMHDLVWMSDCLVLVLRYCLLLLVPGYLQLHVSSYKYNYAKFVQFSTHKGSMYLPGFLSSFVLSSDSLFSPETFHHVPTAKIFSLN